MIESLIKLFTENQKLSLTFGLPSFSGFIMMY